MALVCILFSQLGIHLASKSIQFHESCHSFESFKECIVYCRIMLWYLPGLSQCCQLLGRAIQCSKGNLKLTSTFKTTFVSVPFDLILWLHHTQNSRTLFQVLCRQCGIHHRPPLTRLFLSTSTHHPRNSLRNKFSTFRSVCFNDRFSRSRHRFTSLTFDRKSLLGVQQQDLYSHSVDCTRVPCESLTLMVISLTLVNSSHHWLVINVVSTMFDFRNWNRSPQA